MNIPQTLVAGANSMSISYKNMENNIILVLRKRYKLNISDAKEAVAISPLKEVFMEDPEMAAHTSNETWAREILAYWNKYKSKPSS